MTSITIRNLDPFIKTRLRVRAAEHGRSMEEEARDILRCELAREPQSEENLAEAIRKLFEPVGFMELPEFDSGPVREPPRFDDDVR